MKKIITKTGVIFVSLIFVVSILAIPVDQPFMQAALSNLKDAKNSLRKATADKGGHRANAIDLTDKAIDAVNDGIKWDREHLTPRGRHEGTDNSFDSVDTSTPDQPNMEKARDHLKDAMANLRKASADKGGYREKAIDLIERAIREINQGIEFDRKH